MRIKTWYNKGGRTTIEIFTYKDYLKYNEIVRTKKLVSKKNEIYISYIAEEDAKYEVGPQKINNEHDKVFRKILDDKKEACKFISKSLELGYLLKEEQIEKYNTSFVTDSLQNKEADIVYKLKNSNIFFLIEHQTKIDYTMPFRMLEYEVAIMKSALDKTRLNKKEYKLPEVIPIVLYTGKKKWNANKYIREIQERLEGYDGIEFGKYNLIDVNDFDDEELLKEESFLSKAMLIEKARYTNSLPNSLDEIIKEINKRTDIYTNEQKNLLITIINLVLRTKLNDEEKEEMVKSLKGGEKNMLAVLEMIEEENKRLLAKGERKGRKEGKVEIAKKMLDEKADIDFISRVTGLTKKELDELKNNLEMKKKA